MRVNIYIRKEDEEAWASLKDKPGFIHTALSVREGFEDFRKENPRPLTQEDIDGMARDLKMAVQRDTPVNPDVPFCQHDNPITTCVNPTCVKKARDKGLI
jgi:hypothetical protein